MLRLARACLVWRFGVRGMAQRYRADGVRIAHDPYAPGMAEKYGMPGETDAQGFDPYADTVGPGIYGGIVKRDEDGRVVIGRQYQNHNPRPGPVYAGGGYTPTCRALSDASRLRTLLTKFPELANDVSTGGALPLHNCGMSQQNQGQVSILVEAGADIEALDTYGYTPLHRMASNNLAHGAQLLLNAGADPNFLGGSGETPAQIARSSHATDVLRLLNQWGAKKKHVAIHKITVSGASASIVNGDYIRAPDAKIPPPGFVAVCHEQKWDPIAMWIQLAQNKDYFVHLNKSYIYWNAADKSWWIDAPEGHGVYKAPGPAHAPPALGWKCLLDEDSCLPPTFVGTFRELD